MHFRGVPGRIPGVLGDLTGFKLSFKELRRVSRRLRCGLRSFNAIPLVARYQRLSK